MRRSIPPSMRALIVFLMAGVAAMLSPGTVSAHTGFDYSVPTDGASVGEVLSEVSVAFTEPVTLVGNGFEVLDPQGNVLLPFAVTDDDKLFRLQFDPPLAGGQVGVRYEVTSADGHVVAGGFQFTVSVELPVVTTPPASAAPITTAPPTEAPLTAAPATAPPTTSPTAVVATATDTLTTVTPVDDETSSTGVYIAISAAVALAAAAFLVLRTRTAR